MSSVFKRKDGKWCGKWKKDGTWRYVYRSSEGAVREALEQKSRYEESIPVVRKDNRRVGKLLDEWLEDLDGTVSRRTYLNRESLIRIHLKPSLGSVKVEDLTPRDVRKLLRSKLEDLAPSTVKRLHLILKSALPSRAMEGVKPPRIETNELHVLSKDQLLHLLETVKGDRLEGVYVLGAVCGLRIGESLGLRWEDVSFESQTVQIRRTVWRGRVFQPKTSNSRRTLRLPKRALDSLIRLGNESDADGYLFGTSNGNPIDPANFHRWSWTPTIRKCGLDGLTYHQLRHGAASLLLNQNVPVPVVSRYLGHANPSVTLRIYAHCLDGTSHLAARAMDSIVA